MTEPSSDTGDRWIWIPHWEADDEHPGFQHYKDRDPIWIKNYRWLLADDDYLDLSLAARGLLHGLWLAVARAGNGRIPARPTSIARHLGVDGSFKMRQLEPLIQAGFVDLRASRSLATRYQPASPEEKRGEKNRKEKNESGDASLATDERAARVAAEEEAPPPGLVAHEAFKENGLPVLRIAPVQSIDDAIRPTPRPATPHKPLLTNCQHDGMKPARTEGNMQIWKCPSCGLEQADAV